MKNETTGCLEYVEIAPKERTDKNQNTTESIIKTETTEQPISHDTGNRNISGNATVNASIVTSKITTTTSNAPITTTANTIKAVGDRLQIATKDIRNFEIDADEEKTEDEEDTEIDEVCFSNP